MNSRILEKIKNDELLDKSEIIREGDKK